MRSLEEFPSAFQPIVTVTGDRRELPPHSRGDLLAYSVSSTDYMFINHLGLGQSQVLSDKQFVIDPEEILRKRFGTTNILVIGSPAVNLLARRVNEFAAFRFDISPEAYEELQEQYRFMDEFVEPLGDDLFIYHQCLEGIVDVDGILRRFVDLEPNLEELRKRAERITEAFRNTRIFRYLGTHPRPVRYLLHKLDKPGIFDSLAATKRGEAIGANKDYGLISVLDNPFSSRPGEYSVIYVAGVHGPGTALGLRLLGNRQAFQHHPFGGVFEVHLDRFAAFFEKFQQSKERWETLPYGEAEYRAALEQSYPARIKAFLSSPAPKNDASQRRFNTTVRDLLADVCRERRLKLDMEGPYTLPLGGGTNFWYDILAYEEDCAFVVHDVTGASRGVMVELGFTIGKNKKHFLIWNSEKVPVTNWAQMKVPSLLPTTNIEPINLSEQATAREILAKKIIAKSLGSGTGTDCASCEVRTSEIKDGSCFVYATEPSLERYLETQMAERDISRATEGESSRQSRLCRICEVVRKANVAFVEVSDKDRSGFILLGLAMASGVRTIPFTLGRSKRRDFPWAEQVIGYSLRSMQERLGDKVAEVLQSEFQRETE